MSGNVVMLLLLVVFSLCNLVHSGNIHASIKNRIGNERNVTVHCQSKDNDLGQKTIADGGEIGWDFSVNAVGTTLFYCDLEWKDVEEYHFDAYSFPRDYARCETRCSWLISTEGMYGLNGQTGFWEFFYHWPS